MTTPSFSDLARALSADMSPAPRDDLDESKPRARREFEDEAQRPYVRALVPALREICAARRIMPPGPKRHAINCAIDKIAGDIRRLADEVLGPLTPQTGDPK